MHVLVTGGAGFIGSHLVAALRRRGDDVTVLDNFDDYYDPALKRRNVALVGDGVRVVEGDLRSASDVDDALRGVDAVAHLAARAGVRPSLTQGALYIDVNVTGTQSLLDGMERAGIRRMIYASSSSVYGARSQGPFSESDAVHRPVSPYAATKLAGELLIHAASQTRELSATCLRLFTVYGPRQRPEMAIHLFARKALAGEAILRFGDGLSRRDYTYVDDIVAGLVAALDQPRPYGVYNLGSGAPITLQGLLDGIGEAFDVELRIEQLPDQPGDVPATWADITRAREDLGWTPRVTLSDGLRRFRDWLLTSA